MGWILGLWFVLMRGAGFCFIQETRLCGLANGFVKRLVGNRWLVYNVGIVFEMDDSSFAQYG